MSELSAKNRKFLAEKFGDRVNFNPTERMLYSHDIAAIPGMVKPVIGNTVPKAVVQPESENELVELIKWANKKRIPVTPRAKASSGYGGVIPVKNGIVIDFYRMNKVLKVDKKKMTARVQAGIVWEKLDAALVKDDLTITTYPTSYPASTAGGWLAQGGAGIGAYEAGWFKESVLSARVVFPDGSAKELKGKDLDLVADAEGITGLITELKLKVMKKDELDVTSIGCPNVHDMQKLVAAIVEYELPIWSLIFINPRMAEMKNKAPLMTHHGHPAEERVLLPASYVMTLAYRKKDTKKVKDKLQEIVELCEAEVLSEKIANHEWEHRFKLMVVKRLGPSLVPAEVVIPLESLGDVLTEIEDKVDQPIVKEGVVIKEGEDGKPEVVILGFIPSDERRFSYNFVFSLVLTIMKIAEKYGGRPYSTGLYFAKKAKEIMGTDRVKRLKKFKKKVDPRGILNPGKVLKGGAMGLLMNVAGLFEPIIRPFGNYVITKVGERPGKTKRDIPADVAWYAYSCSQCGYCIEECDQFYGRGWESQSPRGKWYWLRRFVEGREDWDQFMVDTMLVCTTCELCNLRCSAALPIEPSWMKLRGQLINEEKRMTFPPFEVMAASLRAEGDIWAGYRENRTDWFPKDLIKKHGTKAKSKNVYFAGCTASYVEHDIAIASVRLLDEAGVDFTHLGNVENCCGTPMLVAGKWDLFKDIMKANIKAVKDAGADTVISSCPACDMMWRVYYPKWAKELGIDYDITAKHYSEIVAEKIDSGEFKFDGKKKSKRQTVTWHDSCHIGRASGVYDPPRKLIDAVPNVKRVEMAHCREDGECCGSVLTLIKDPPVAADVGEIRLNEAIEAGAQKVLALCPCCEFQLRVSRDKKNIPLEIEDLARFCVETLGYELPDPHPEVRKQWAVFEAMIALMTPEGFAELMGTMWKELIDAMPFGMGKMMRAFGKVPGALKMMKPMFPVLFPRLLPKMMPKVLPTMLERIGERIPMPDYMAEQMPDLMPQVMDNLMPHMVKDLVPLVSDPMIAYLRGKNQNAIG